MKRLAWRSWFTGAIGHGEWLDVKDSFLEDMVRNANEAFPDLTHWVEDKAAQDYPATRAMVAEIRRCLIDTFRTETNWDVIHKGLAEWPDETPATPKPTPSNGTLSDEGLSGDREGSNSNHTL